MGRSATQATMFRPRRRSRQAPPGRQIDRSSPARWLQFKSGTRCPGRQLGGSSGKHERLKHPTFPESEVILVPRTERIATLATRQSPPRPDLRAHLDQHPPTRTEYASSARRSEGAHSTLNRNAQCGEGGDPQQVIDVCELHPVPTPASGIGRTVLPCHDLKRRDETLRKNIVATLHHILRPAIIPTTHLSAGSSVQPIQPYSAWRHVCHPASTHPK